MNKEELIKGYTCRFQPSEVKDENNPHKLPKPNNIYPPRAIPFHTVRDLCERPSEIRYFRTAGYCIYNGIDVELLSVEGTKRIILDFEAGVRKFETNTECQDPVPVELVGTVFGFDEHRIKIGVSFCTILSDSQELAAVLKYHESVNKYLKM